MNEEQHPYNWLGVMDFIQSEYSKNQLKDKEWTFERQTLLNKITKLEAESKMHETVHLDLMRRVRVLEVALREER
jgi:striatin 1/3/4